jgi:hypothetical protein
MVRSTRPFRFVPTLAVCAGLAAACSITPTPVQPIDPCPGELTCPNLLCCPAGYPFFCDGKCHTAVSGCASSYVTCTSQAASGAPLPSCSSTDMDCILSHLRVRDPNGNAVELIRISAGTIAPSQIGPGKGLPTISDALSSPAPLTFASWDSWIGLSLAFTDPNGARIGGCFHVHPKGQVPGPFGGFPVMAFKSVPDGQTSGDLPIEISAGFQPIEGSAEYSIDLYPISPIAVGQEAVAQALAGGGIAVGDPISVTALVGAGGGSPGGSSSSGSGSSSGGTGTCGLPATCASDNDCSGFGARNCMPASGGRCGGDGKCHCCYAACGSQCSCLDCSVCNMVATTCIGSTCAFTVGGTPCQ